MAQLHVGMFRITVSFFALMCLVLSASAQTTQGLSALQQAIEDTASARADYVFQVEHTFAGESFQALFAPRGQPHITLISPASRDSLSEQLRTDFDYIAEHTEGIPWCATEMLAHIRDLRLVRQDDAVAVFSFQPTARSVTGEQTRQVVSHLRGQITIDKARRDVSHVRLFAPRPFRPYPIALVNVYTVTTTCALAPNGRYYVSEQTRQVRSNAFGRSFNIDVVRRNRVLPFSQ